MTSRITIRLQRSPICSSVKLIGQPDRPVCCTANLLEFLLALCKRSEYSSTTCTLQVLRGPATSKEESNTRAAFITGHRGNSVVRVAGKVAATTRHDELAFR